MHSRGGTCPRCHGYTGLAFRGEDPKMLQHRTPYGARCGYGGVTRSQAQSGWTALSLRTYKWLLANAPQRAADYRASRVTD